MRLYHLSHTDLDGYGCQLLTKEVFQEGFFINANYGLEVKIALQTILNDINLHTNEEILLLISDLNLTLAESKELNANIEALKNQNVNIKLQLLDHHSTGEKCALKYEWYFLDTQRSATKIVYDYLCEHYNAFKTDNQSWVKPLVDAINAIDIWLEEQTQSFEFGKVLMRLVTKANEINATLFSDENRAFRLFLLKKAASFVHEPQGNILLDDAIHRIKKEYLKLNEKEDTIDNLSASYLVHTLQNKKEDLTIFYKEHKGLLTYTLGSISIPANSFLKANCDYDFFIDVGRRGSISLRANGKVNVAIIAQKLANGGGHPNAAGAKLEDFKETINYQEVKSYIQAKLDSLT
jgi:oligoribonuclease NrnB/cAMP/cGMP phosphodiesterase (DHH superfamily)